MNESDCFLAVKDGEKIHWYPLSAQARYAQDFDLIRVWDEVHTYVIHPENLAALCVRNQGPLKSK